MSYKRQSPMPIIEGGTNASTFATTDGTVIFDGTRLITIATGTSGQILTSAGAGVAPSFQTGAGATISITGDTGGALSSGTFTFTGGTTGLSFGGSGTTETLTFAGITANGGTVSLATDATASAINIGTGAGVKTVTIGSTNSTSVTTIASGTGGANFGTSANAHATIVGSTTAGSTTTLQAPSAGVVLTGVQGVAVANKNYVTINTATGAIGSDAGPSGGITTITGDTGGALSGTNITFAGGTTGLSFGGSGTTETLTFAGITANGGTVSLATDATTSTVNVGTGAGAKTVTLGSTNTTSLLALKYGTADFTLASATGTVMSALDTGEITYPLQSAFLTSNTGSQANVTGNGGSFVTVTYTVEIYDQNNDYDGTSTFTAPVAGRYLFTMGVRFQDTGATSTQGIIRFTTSNRNYELINISFATIQNGGVVELNASTYADMDATDTATVAVRVNGMAGDTVDIVGTTFFGGSLIC